VIPELRCFFVPFGDFLLVGGGRAVSLLVQPLTEIFVGADENFETLIEFGVL
jgi:hypothetical protein